MLVKDWWYAYKVCKKYNIRWIPFYGLSYAEFKGSLIRFDGRVEMFNLRVYVNPFYPKFLDVFMHEVGHCVWYDRQAKKANGSYLKAVSLMDRDSLHKEYVAWRYAKLARRGKLHKENAEEAFKTYFPPALAEIGLQSAVDSYYTYSRGIRR